MVTLVTTAEGVAEEAVHPLEAAHVERAAAKRRNEFFAGRRCARQALAQLGVRDFALLPDSNRVPRWPEGIVGSITHCAAYAGAAVAPASTLDGLGFDAEPVGAVKDEIARRICSKAELEQIQGLERRVPRDWATLFFSAKESFYKAYFPLARRFLGFHDVEVSFEPARCGFQIRFVEGEFPLAERAGSFAGRFVQDDVRVYTGVVLPRAR